MDAAPGIAGLVGHVAPRAKLPGMRDTDNVKAFVEEFDKYEQNYDSTDPNKRLPNYIVMSLPEDHTRGTAVGAHTPVAMVANHVFFQPRGALRDVALAHIRVATAIDGLAGCGLAIEAIVERLTQVRGIGRWSVPVGYSSDIHRTRSDVGRTRTHADR